MTTNLKEYENVKFIGEPFSKYSKSSNFIIILRELGYIDPINPKFI